MGEAASVPKLTAILAADVAGYSRMMRADQRGTIDGLVLRREILDEAVARRRGRIANTAGDSVLAEFGSVIDALHCATEIQEAVAHANERLSRDQQMSFRIGVHTGEVFARGGDLLGDGVNVAARLQSLAPPGGIYTSAVVREQVRGILSLQFKDLGQQRLKNIRQPVRVFSVTLPTPGKIVRRGRDRRRISVWRSAAMLALVLIIGSSGAAWWLHPPWLERLMAEISGNGSPQPIATEVLPAPAETRPPQAVAATPPPSAPKPGNPQAPPANSSASDALELALWQSTTAQGSQSAFEQYLRQYPSGHFAELAKAKIDEFKNTQSSAAASAPTPTVEDAPVQLAQGIPFDCPKPGTTIAYSDGERLTFRGRAGFRCQALSADGKKIDEYAALISLATAPSLAGQDLERFWPLREGDELSFTTRSPDLFPYFNSDQPYVTNQYRVVGTERVHVPAGTFNAVIIERHLQALVSGRGAFIDVTQRLWYAPKVAHIVKIVTDRGADTFVVQRALPAKIEATEITIP